MSEVFGFHCDDLIPDRETLLGGMDILPHRASNKHLGWAEEASLRFRQLARPVAVVCNVDAESFARVFAGEGLNESPNPLETVYPRALRLAVFALNMGKAVSEEIGSLFAGGFEVEGVFLDAVASRAAENASEQLGLQWLGALKAEGGVPEACVVMGYSPGYCGWHLSGQRKLLECAGAAQIGITLNDSCLMDPLKSVSGVFAAGGRELFADGEDYPFCGVCATRTCRERRRRIHEWK
jgi:Vitamin B12 dependent methionine synthase, activation domain